MFTRIKNIITDWIKASSEQSSGNRISLLLFLFKLMVGGGVNFYRYFRDLGLAFGPGLIMVSPKDSFKCELHELKRARTLINLKKLNLVKYLDVFLTSLAKILPPDTNFIGCFSDRHDLRSEVVNLLEKNNFRIVDMKVLNGETYFVSKIRS